ncbi:MAG: AbrB/MazE/SpoVT family DNA-binding domain-containing protein [Boseongicola sp. SB0675_bin_26]|nr:AbrB/MazE/SpoVT family DNA-binding domain-containing protein [Boseongicola sp. SB0675_bin_26]
MPPRVREFSLFRNNRNQAIRIPVEFELPGDHALIRKEGERLPVEPKDKAGLLGLLSLRERLDEAVLDVDDLVPDGHDIL